MQIYARNAKSLIDWRWRRFFFVLVLLLAFQKVSANNCSGNCLQGVSRASQVGEVTFDARSWPVLFQNWPGLDAAHQILTEINKVFVMANEPSIRAQSNPFKYMLDDNCELETQNFVYFHLPSGYSLPQTLLREGFGNLVHYQDLDYLIITQRVMTLFQEAIDFRDRHKQAFSALNVFKDAYQSIAAGDASQEGLEQILSYEFLSQADAEMFRKSINNENPFLGTELIGPHLLDVYTQTMDFDNSESRLAAQVVIYSHGNGKEIGQLLIMLYDNELNTWRLVVPAY